MRKGDFHNPSIDRQEKLASLELEIKATREGNNAKKGMANLGIFEEEEVVETTMEVQVESLEIMTIWKILTYRLKKQKKVFQYYG
jgi:hypothetical protein